MIPVLNEDGCINQLCLLVCCCLEEEYCPGSGVGGESDSCSSGEEEGESEEVEEVEEMETPAKKVCSCTSMYVEYTSTLCN